MILINFLKTHSVICYLKCFNSSYLEVVVKVAGHCAGLLPLDSDPVHLAPGAVREAVVATVLNIIHIDNDSDSDNDNDNDSDHGSPGDQSPGCPASN